MNSLRIKVLPDDLINKIAAGEVVERPASVVKELVENSIDAGATQITVEIQNAGKKLIKVSDNGCGMTLEEIEISLQRHSTSKIASLEDLFNITTLGFRGEALPSIASVSKMTLEQNPSGAGLTATIKELFFNTPARKKFLKADSTETNHCLDIVSKASLVNPKIAFRFISDGKPLLASPGNGKTIDAIAAVYGTDIARGLIEVKTENISGFISSPTVTRLDKNYEVFFVNGRHIRNFLLNRALEEAYRTLIPNNRYPVGIIFIKIDPQKVDVNVHPSKREVKFQNNQEVMDQIRVAVGKALEGVRGYQNIRVSEGRYQEISGSGEGWKPESMEPFFGMTNNQIQMTNEFPTPNTNVEFEITAVQPLMPIYQFKNTYIVATDGDELVLIDQHAAHERIIYDRVRSRESGVGSNRQMLLIPETLQISANEAATLRENLAILNELGFEIEEFGGNSFLIRGTPAVSIKADPKKLIIDCITEIGTFEKTVQLEIKRENMCKMIACKSAIKAGDGLNQLEMNQLIRDLYATENPLTCPHGRPTMIKIGEQELIKRFLR
ncbi:MAG: DNA mismatch repair endonuclease MutL [Candidatus Margulisiibacteriota bacterium]